jgi:hypothetical protein
VYTKKYKTKGRSFLKQISNEVFQEMLKSGLLKTSKGNKNFTVTSQQKGSKRKKFYVSMPDYLKFERTKYKSRGR